MTLPLLPVHRTAAFGLTWQSDLPLTQFNAENGEGSAPDVIIRRVDKLQERQPLSHINRGILFADGFRFAWADEAVFDYFETGRVEYCPGSQWHGHFPHAFFGTVTGLILAMQGYLPFHACSVELDGKSLLICGKGGTGKSTMTAGIIKLGGRLLSDDLSAIRLHAGKVIVMPGRPSLRLFPDIAQWMTDFAQTPTGHGGRGKILVSAEPHIARSAVPLSAILMLGEPNVPLHPVMRIAMLRHQFFRPKWMAALPFAHKRLEILGDIERNIPILTFPAEEEQTAERFAARANSVMEMVTRS